MSVALVGPDGKSYEFDGGPAELEAAKAQGFRVAEDIGPIESALDTAKAAGLGAVQGLTGGLYGAGSNSEQGEEEKPESAQARWAEGAELSRAAEEHPIASGVGEFAGMVLSPINKVGVGITSGIGATTRLGRIGAAAVGGGATGALFGAGKTLSDAALGDVDLTAEKLMAGAGLGAVLGLAGGGIGGALEEGVAAAVPGVKRLLGRSQSALDDVANDATISATRAQQGVINRLGDEKTTAAAKALREGGHLEGKLLTTPDDILKSVETRIGKTGAEKGSILELAEAGGAKPAYSELAKRLDDFEAGLNPLQKKIIKNDLQELREGVAEIGMRPATASGKEGSGFRALDDLRQSVAKRAKFSKGAAGADDETLALKRQLAGTFRDEVDRQLVPQLGADIGKHYADTKALYGALKDAATLAKSGTGRPGGFGLKDLAAAAIGAGVHPLGIAAALGSKVMREHGPVLIARIADKLAKEPALQAVAQSFAASLPSAAPKLGPYAAVLAQGAAQGPAHALATHMAYAQVDPEYAATAQLAGLTPEQPDEHAAVMGRAQDVATLATRLTEQDAEIDRHLNHVFRGTRPGGSDAPMKSQDFGAKRMRRDSLAAHEKRVDEVRLLATDPNALIERITANAGKMGDYAPGVVAAMTARASRAVQYLAKEAEEPPPAGPLAPRRVPNEATRFAFAQKLQVVQEPMSVLRSASAGTLTREQMRTLQTVYPTIAREIQNKALERMASGGDVPYKSRMMLAVLTGIDPDGTMNPASVARNQAAIAKSQQAAEPVAASQSADSKLTLASRSATPEQRREMRASDE